jgi:hypothetical protein
MLQLECLWSACKQVTERAESAVHKQIIASNVNSLAVNRGIVVYRAKSTSNTISPFSSLFVYMDSIDNPNKLYAWTFMFMSRQRMQGKIIMQ